MLLKKSKPITPSQRTFIRLNNLELTKVPLLKNKIKGLKNKSGTNNSGKIVSYQKGGGNKTRYRKIDFTRNTYSIGIVVTKEYDPYRSGNICSIYDFVSKEYYYILSPSDLYIGNIIESGFNVEIFNGNSVPLSRVPVGSLIHNVSTKIGKHAEISRSAGTFSKLIGKTLENARILLKSGEQRYVSSKCFVTIGSVSNEAWFLTTLGKAGRSRWLNKRPTVRGVAKNPVDHPHGGGEGKTSGGRVSVTPWGKPTRNIKTSKSKNKLRILN